MNDTTSKLLLAQGFTKEDLCGKNFSLLSKWTPVFCGSLALIAAVTASWHMFAVLSAAAVFGAFNKHSAFDLLYIHGFRKLIDLGEMSQHGAPRKMGCGIGGAMFAMSAGGFYLHNIWLAYLPSGMMIILAYLAAFSNWCFASFLYGLIFRKKNCSCC